MFNEITTFGTTGFYLIALINMATIYVYFYLAKPFIAIVKEFNPKLYGKVGLFVQFTLAAISAFVPWLNIVNLVSFAIFTLFYVFIRVKFGKIEKIFG